MTTPDAATTTVGRPSDPDLLRFDRTERIAHWCTATLILMLMATGAALYAGPLSTLVGRRELVRTMHVIAGLALPSRWSSASSATGARACAATSAA